MLFYTIVLKANTMDLYQNNHWKLKYIPDIGLKYLINFEYRSSLTAEQHAAWRRLKYVRLWDKQLKPKKQFLTWSVLYAIMETLWSCYKYFIYFFFICILQLDENACL